MKKNCLRSVLFYSFIKPWSPAKVSPFLKMDLKIASLLAITDESPSRHRAVPALSLSKRPSKVPGAWHIYCLLLDFLRVHIFKFITFMFCYLVTYVSYYKKCVSFSLHSSLYGTTVICFFKYVQYFWILQWWSRAVK